MNFSNDYEDSERAAAYARMQFPGTYELAFRWLGEIVDRWVAGRDALDFGCGAGRSTRLIESWGYQTIGIDISGEMLAEARRIDPHGDYRQVRDDGVIPFPDSSFDLALSAFTFDNIPTEAKKTRLLRDLRRVLKPEGRLVNLVSTPEIYRYEWVSFTTRDFPNNRLAGPGDPVLITNTSSGDRGPVTDILCPDESYRQIYAEAGLELLEMRKLLARPDEPTPWISEHRIAPWCVYVLRPAP